jgi:hypothetical protein
VAALAPVESAHVMAPRGAMLATLDG